MPCDCGGVLLVTAVEEFPNNLSSKEKINFNHVCDVECQKCGKIYYSQPYDGNQSLNQVRDTKKL